MRFKAIRLSLLSCLPAALLLGAAPSVAQSDPTAAPPSWTDLVDLSDASQLVVRAKVKKQAELEPERAVGVAPGYTRLYVEAETLALISGNVPVGESLRYLVDVPLTSKGKAPKLKKSEVLLFARAVPQQPSAVQLVTPDAQLPWTQDLGERLRPILASLAAPSAPPEIVGIRDALSASGNLDGESETQIFLRTESGAPLSLSVVRRPGFDPVPLLLPPGSADWLLALMEGKTLEQAADAAPAFDLGATLALLLQNEAIVSIEVGV